MNKEKSQDLSGNEKAGAKFVPMLHPVESTDKELEQRFFNLANRWRKESRYISSITQRISHVAYLEIIALGLPAVPLILHELERTRDHWIEALRIITGEDPARGTDVYDDAVEAWLNWGRRNHYL